MVALIRFFSILTKGKIKYCFLYCFFLFCSVLIKEFVYLSGYDDYLDDDDLDLIEENLGVKVKRRVSHQSFCLF